MVNFEENYHFSRYQSGSNFFHGGGGGGGGGGGSNCLFPIETHITCDFPGGGGGSEPLSPSGSALVNSYIPLDKLKINQRIFYKLPNSVF